MKLTALVFTLFILAVPALSRAAEGYAIPDISKAKLVGVEKQIIKDAKPATEIEIRTYKGDNGWLFRSYSVGGYVFRYDIAESGVKPYTYRLIDNKGDGTFETKEGLTGEVAVEGKAEGKGLRYFIDLGPEPGKEYTYSWMEEAAKQPGAREELQTLMGLPIYIPQWVLLRIR